LDIVRRIADNQLHGLVGQLSEHLEAIIYDHVMPGALGQLGFYMRRMPLAVFGE
jgi:hypothetical protein